MAHFAVFEKHYRNLEQALPANAMLSTFISKGLLRDITLLQRVACENTDCGKTRLLLESMRGGLKIGETKTFEKFLEALCEYADRNNDLVVKKLVEDVYKDWRFPENLKRQRYAGIYLSLFSVIGSTTHTNGMQFACPSMPYSSKSTQSVCMPI